MGKLPNQIATPRGNLYNPAMPEDKPVPEADARPASSGAKKRPLSKRLLRLGLFLLYILIIAEIGSRVYWKIKRDMPFFSGREDWYNRFYDEMKDSNVWTTDLRPDDGYFDVLLLGGSALDRIYTTLGKDSQIIQDKFEKFINKSTKSNKPAKPVRVFNLANPGLTTRDSLIKYRVLGDAKKHFDLVIVYHGINDTRLNNCPPDKFKDDYTHGGWYEQIRRMEDQVGMMPFFTLPYTIQYTTIHIMSSKKLHFYVPRHKQNPDWVAHGTNIKTGEPFRRNMQEILNLAVTRSEPVIVMPFAWYVPEDYSIVKCKGGQLDYAPSPAPSAVELWGSIEGVTKGLKVHNDIIRSLAEENKAVIFADTEGFIPKIGENFHDVCHLSPAGKKLWLQAVLTAMKTRGAAQ